jgi:hypothetical protein
VRLTAIPGVVNPGIVRGEATFLLNAVAPTAVTLDVETHCDTAYAAEQVFAHNQVTDAWDEIDARRAKRVDNLRTVTLANPANYVIAATKSIEIRIDGRGVGGGGSSATPVLFIDQLRMNVTYP